MLEKKDFKENIKDIFFIYSNIQPKKRIFKFKIYLFMLQQVDFKEIKGILTNFNKISDFFNKKYIFVNFHYF